MFLAYALNIFSFALLLTDGDTANPPHFVIPFETHVDNPSNLPCLKVIYYNIDSWNTSNFAHITEMFLERSILPSNKCVFTHNTNVTCGSCRCNTGDPEPGFWLKWQFHLYCVYFMKNQSCLISSKSVDHDYFWHQLDSKLVVLDVFGFPSTNAELDIVRTKYPRMRDYSHVDPYLFGPCHNFEILVAESVNATMIGNGVTEVKASLENYPHFYPLLFTLKTLDDNFPTMHQMWRKYRFSPKGQFHLILFPEPEFNFGYCDTVKWIPVNPWNFEVIAYSVHKYVWILLFASMITLTLVVSWEIRDNFSYYLNFQSILSVLIAGGPTINRTQSKSHLLILWMFVCTILVTFYSGTSTGFLIIPSKVDIMTSLDDVFERNYSVMYDLPLTLLRIKATLKMMEENADKGTTFMRNLLRSTFVTENKTERVETLGLSSKKVVFVKYWQYVIEALNEAIDLIQRKQLQAKRHCYLGKQLYPLTDRFYGFSPPGSHLLYKSSQFLLQSGLFKFWDDEFWKIMTAKRVQDRTKVISATAVKYDYGSEVRPVQLDGKIRTVFFLWLICLFFCCISLTIEFAIFKLLCVTSITWLVKLLTRSYSSANN